MRGSPSRSCGPGPVRCAGHPRPGRRAAPGCGPAEPIDSTRTVVPVSRRTEQALANAFSLTTGREPNGGSRAGWPAIPDAAPGLAHLDAAKRRQGGRCNAYRQLPDGSRVDNVRGAAPIPGARERAVASRPSTCRSGRRGSGQTEREALFGRSSTSQVPSDCARATCPIR